MTEKPFETFAEWLFRFHEELFHPKLNLLIDPNRLPKKQSIHTFARSDPFFMLGSTIIEFGTH